MLLPRTKAVEPSIVLSIRFLLSIPVIICLFLFNTISVVTIVIIVTSVVIFADVPDGHVLGRGARRKVPIVIMVATYRFNKLLTKRQQAPLLLGLDHRALFLSSPLQGRCLGCRVEGKPNRSACVGARVSEFIFFRARPPNP